MHICIALYGAARVVIGTPQMDIEFDNPTNTLGDVLEKIITQYPRAQPYLLDETGKLPSYIRVLINDVRPVPDATPATPLHDQDRIALLVAVAGGKRRLLLRQASCDRCLLIRNSFRSECKSAKCSLTEYY